MVLRKEHFIYCDRMRKCHAQTFRGEDSCDNEPKNKCELEIGDSAPRDNIHNEGAEPFIYMSVSA